MQAHMPSRCTQTHLQFSESMEQIDDPIFRGNQTAIQSHLKRHEDLIVRV